MAKTLMEKLNEMTDFEYEYLKLSSCDVFIRGKRININIIYPADKEAFVFAAKEKLENAVLQILNSTATVCVKFKKSYFDFAFFKTDLFAFLAAYPSVANTLSDGDITEKMENGAHTITITLEESVYDYCIGQKVLAAIEVFVFNSFCERINVTLVSKGDTNLYVADVETVDALEYDSPCGRQIRPQNVEDFIGNIIYDPAMYIEDAKSNKDGAVLCGTVGKILEIVRKPKEGEELALRKKFYKFTLTDYTGVMPCVYFPSKKTADQIGLLVEGKQIVARGKLEVDTYHNDGSMSYMIRDISLCSLPEDFVVNRIKLKVPTEYAVVFPTENVVSEQASLFDGGGGARKQIPPYAIGKTFCVFDLETTGFNPDADKIIEIGAVKMVDGKVVETFSSFVNPQELLSEKIKSLTHIEDAYLRDAPLIENVLPDFFKFSANTILVGHNVQFDCGFVEAKGKPLNIYFDNEKMDTLSLARKYFPKIGKYKLECVAEYFGVVNKGAHRAIYDAWATAEVFLEIAKMLPLNA